MTFVNPVRRPSCTGSQVLPVLSVLLLGSIASASELVVRDLGISLDLPPSGFRYTLTDDAGERSGTDALKSHLGIVLGGRYSLAGTGATSGLVVGGGLAADRATYGSSGSWSSYSLRGTAGWGWAATDRLTLLGEALLGLGAARLSVDGGGTFGSYSARGGLVEPGLQVAATFAMTDELILTGDLGWRRASAKLTGDDADIDVTRSGFAFGVGVAWRFSNRPFLLE